ncbi:MAG: purine-nucleoside phosphorylase [Alphaproteobacteria bacterium]|nr:purine-nucleoside phosphorylase [Alphaproteobacteria bacterium]
MPSVCFSFAKQLKEKLNGFIPEMVLILGSGLGSLAENIQNRQIIKYADIEGFPQSTVIGHENQFIAGHLKGKKVLCMQGRFHLYEGVDPQLINQVISAFKLLGVKGMVITNAAGSLNPDMPAGSLMLITDHINLSGRNPLIGTNDDDIGPRFPDLTHAYDQKLLSLARKTAKDLNLPLFEGIYTMVTGPNFETPAEVKAFARLGGDAVGMSTVPEVLCAVHAGLEVLGFSVITNLGAGLQQKEQTHEETLTMANKAAQSLSLLLSAIFERM